MSGDGGRWQTVGDFQVSCFRTLTTIINALPRDIYTSPQNAMEASLDSGIAPRIATLD